MKSGARFHNFTNFQKFITPRIMYKICWNRVSGHFGGRWSSSCCQKFRQQLQKLDFFGEKNAKIGIFDCSFWEGRGCAWSEIFFCGDPHWLGVKPHGRPKRRPGPPQPTGSRFWPPRIEKWHFSQVFHENLSFLVYFYRSAGTLPDTRNFFQQQVGQNIPTWGMQSKIGNIWPPKSSIPKPTLTNHFQTLKP